MPRQLLDISRLHSLSQEAKQRSSLPALTIYHTSLKAKHQIARPIGGGGVGGGDAEKTPWD